MDLAEMTERVQAALAGGAGFERRVKLDFGPDGVLLVDGAAGVASNEDGPADATIRVGFEDAIKLARGKLDPTMALMQSKLKIEGDIGVVMKLQSLFSRLG